MLTFDLTGSCSYYDQVFCVGLWCLDEYWYYSLFTLFMLFMFESTMAKSRLRTLTELRRVRVDNQIVMVHRGGKYVISLLASSYLGLSSAILKLSCLLG